MHISFHGATQTETGDKRFLALVNGKETVRVYGYNYQVKTGVEIADACSAHAD